MTMEKGAAQVIDRLCAAGYKAYAVGGCVRDSLLGKTPQDWDVCTSARPEQVIALFGEAHTLPTGIKHGTVTVRMDGGFYEVTTFRTEGAYSDGRHPDRVDFIGDVYGDLSRRDFTMNAMAYHPKEGLIDPFGGQHDLLQARVVRAVGDPMKRFEEDALRILRLFRFAAREELTIDAATLEAALALADGLARVSGERIREELMKLLGTKNPGDYMPQRVIAACIPALGGMEEQHYRRMLAQVNAAPEDAALRLALLVQEEADSAKALSALKLDHETLGEVAELVQCTNLAPQDDIRAQARRLLGSVGLRQIERITVLRAAQRACGSPKEELFALLAAARKAQEEGDCCRLRDLAMSGRDVIALGVSPGPRVGRLLEDMLEAVITDEVENTKEALRPWLVKRLERD